MTINVLRYSSAKTAKALRAEIANANSKDHGTGCAFGALCVAIEAGQDFDPLTLADSFYLTSRAPKYTIDINNAVSDATGLAAYLNSQGLSESRKMWRITVDSADLIGLADRVMGGDYHRIYFADGVLLRKGATPLAVEKIA